MYIRIAEFSVKRMCSSHEIGGLLGVSDVYIAAGSQLCSAYKIAIYHVKTLFFCLGAELPPLTKTSNSKI